MLDTVQLFFYSVAEKSKELLAKGEAKDYTTLVKAFELCEQKSKETVESCSEKTKTEVLVPGKRKLTMVFGYHLQRKFVGMHYIGLKPSWFSRKRKKSPTELVTFMERALKDKQDDVVKSNPILTRILLPPTKKSK